MATPRTDEAREENAGTRFDGYVHEDVARKLEEDLGEAARILKACLDHMGTEANRPGWAKDFRDGRALLKRLGGA